jgi:hypothetical protein
MPTHSNGQRSAFVRYRQAMQSSLFTMGLRYVGLRMLKSILADRMSMEMMARTRATLDFTPREDVPAALAPYPEPAKAPLLRKLIDKAFRKLFATGKQNRVGGETEYIGVLQGTNIKVVTDFSGRGLQLRYGVSIPDETKTILVWQLAYDRRTRLGLFGRGRMQKHRSICCASTSLKSCRSATP